MGKIVVAGYTGTPGSTEARRLPRSRFHLSFGGILRVLASVHLVHDAMVVVRTKEIADVGEE